MCILTCPFRLVLLRPDVVDDTVVLQNEHRMNSLAGWNCTTAASLLPALFSRLAVLRIMLPRSMSKEARAM